MADTINEAIEDAAKAGLSKVTVDGRTAEAMPVADQIAAQRYLDSRTAAARNHFGLSFVKIEAPEAG
jgi:hypothetical protein